MTGPGLDPMAPPGLGSGSCAGGGGSGGGGFGEGEWGGGVSFLPLLAVLLVPVGLVALVVAIEWGVMT